MDRKDLFDPDSQMDQLAQYCLFLLMVQWALWGQKALHCLDLLDLLLSHSDLSLPFDHLGLLVQLVL